MSYLAYISEILLMPSSSSWHFRGRCSRRLPLLRSVESQAPRRSTPFDFVHICLKHSHIDLRPDLPHLRGNRTVYGTISVTFAVSCIANWGTYQIHAIMRNLFIVQLGHCCSDDLQPAGGSIVLLPTHPETESRISWSKRFRWTWGWCDVKSSKGPCPF